jgi:2,4-dienoyl-CoA reductase-like NADH-dependent reductase (Old Yellow Enzyme family)
LIAAIARRPLRRPRAAMTQDLKADLFMSSIQDAFPLPCGERLSNRLVKAAITEGLADARGWPTPQLERLYAGWVDAGFGLMISGNIIVDGDHLERPGNVFFDRIPPQPEHLSALRAWTATATRGGAHFWAQLSHSGRQTPRTINSSPLSVSDVPLDLPQALFGRPRAMTIGEIRSVIERFASVAAICKAVGFTGVQIHAAHGYLIGSFLAPNVNNRTDSWGGSLENRARLLLEVVAAVRERVGPGFPVAVKLNSADFQRGGFAAQDSVTVGKWLEAAGVDLIEVSGGSYESPVMLGVSGVGADCEPPPVKASTAAREAYFLDFARALREQLTAPILLTGGLRSREGMQAALDEGIDLVGVARPVCVDQICVKALLEGEADRLPSWEEGLRRAKGLFSANSPIKTLGVLANFAGIYWFYAQLYRLGKGRDPNVKLWPPKAMAEVMLAENALLASRRRMARPALSAEAPSPERIMRVVSRKVS